MAPYPTFSRNPECRACSLSDGCRSVCIPSRMLYVEGDRKDCLFIVGEAPGVQEDYVGECFVGASGQYLEELYLGVLQFPRIADCYAGNVIRCRLPKDTKPTDGQIKACRQYLVRDIARLCQDYNRVWVLCVGSYACQGLLGCTLEKAFRRQLCRLPDVALRKAIMEFVVPPSEADPDLDGTETLSALHLLDKVRVVSTYHPAYLMPGRSPSAIHAVRDHLRLLHEAMTDTLSLMDEPPGFQVGVFPPVNCPPLDYLSIDIETYGAVKGYHEQTVFHPRKSEVIDGIRHADLIQSVALKAVSLRGAEHWLSAYTWADPKHRKAFTAWVRRAINDGAKIVGMNLPFDIQYLRYCDPVLCSLLKPFEAYLLDLAVLNYLDSEVRPERSLKSLAPILGVADYGEGHVGFRRFETAHDLQLLLYNAKDADATLSCALRLMDRIRGAYRGTLKLTDGTLRWYSYVVWLCILMAETGLAIDMEVLQRLADETTINFEHLRVWAEKQGLHLVGKGSQADVKRLFKEAVDTTQLWQDPRLEFTGIRKDLSTGSANLHLLTAYIGSETLIGSQLRTLEALRGCQKLTGTYLTPLRSGTVKAGRQSVVLLDPWGSGTHIAFPTWYPVPSPTKDNSDESGGTKQGRITAKNPAVQTFPPSIMKCLTTRFSPGVLVEADLSQIELRVAALLSGDPQMLKEYHEGIDRHTLRAIELFGHDVLNKPDFKWVWRQIGKTVNFLILFRGGARKLQETVRRDVGVDLPLEKCREIIDAMPDRYPVFWAWQDNLIDTAAQKGYLELPVLGLTRLFAGGELAIQNGDVATLVNFPVQTTAALVMLSAQVSLARKFISGKMQSRVVGNIYDALLVDCPSSEYQVVKFLLKEILPHTPFFETLCGCLGRRVPIEYELERLVVSQPRLHTSSPDATWAARARRVLPKPPDWSPPVTEAHTKTRQQGARKVRAPKREQGEPSCVPF